MYLTNLMKPYISKHKQIAQWSNYLLQRANCIRLENYNPNGMVLGEYGMLMGIERLLMKQEEWANVLAKYWQDYYNVLNNEKFGIYIHRKTNGQLVQKGGT